MQRVMGPGPVRWAWTVMDKTGSLGKEDREMRGVEVVRESARRDGVLPDSAWATAIVLSCFDWSWLITECLKESIDL